MNKLYNKYMTVRGDVYLMRAENAENKKGG